MSGYGLRVPRRLLLRHRILQNYVFIIYTIGFDNKIQFNTNVQPFGNYKRIVINQLGALL